jgi:hypothetical protein
MSGIGMIVFRRDIGNGHDIHAVLDLGDRGSRATAARQISLRDREASR